MNKNVPKLRFKEFNDEWKEYKLKEIADIVGGGTPSTTEDEYWNGEVQWFTPSEIGKSKYVENSIRTITELGVKKSSAKILPIGTILLTTRATLGEMAILKKEGTTNQGFQSLIVKKIYNTEFIYYLKNQISRYCYKNASGSTFLEISKFNLEKCKIKVPSLEEQERIANFFTILDSLIEEQEGKVRDLKIYKKGMMQKIFKQEIRFKDDNGLDYPEWEEKKLNNIVKNRKKGGIPKYIEEGKGQVLLSNEYLEKNVVEKVFVANDIDVFERHILILWDGSQSGKVYTGRRGVLGSTFVLLELDNLNDNRYVYQYLNAKRNMIQEVWREGSGVPHVAKDFIQNFKLKLPCLEEQRRIADFLSNIDNLIEEEQKNLDDLREMKKGLLQQMFV